MVIKMYFIYFYVPASHLETVKKAMFAAGAGKLGVYERCCWQTKGEGQFCPLEGNKAYIGSTNKLEHVEEYKVEMVCETQYIKVVIAAMKKAHPYEEPAYGFWQMEK
jgi:hypothetical protein